MLKETSLLNRQILTLRQQSNWQNFVPKNMVPRKRLKKWTWPWKSTLLYPITIRGEPDDIVDAPVKALPSVSVGKNIWVPYTGAVIRGKHDVTYKELTEPAFGMDLSGISVANLKKGSILPIGIEVVNDEGLMLIGTIVPKEVSRTFRSESSKLVRGRGQHGVTSFSSVWLPVTN